MCTSKFVDWIPGPPGAQQEYLLRLLKLIVKLKEKCKPYYHLIVYKEFKLVPRYYILKGYGCKLSYKLLGNSTLELITPLFNLT